MPIEKQFSDDLVAGAAVRDGEGNIISSTYAPATAIPNPDWNEEDSSSKDYIKNKPIWLETTTLSSEKMEFPPPYWAITSDQYFGELAITQVNIHLELTEGETYYIYQDDIPLLSATATTTIVDDHTVCQLTFQNDVDFILMGIDVEISEAGEESYNPESTVIIASKSLYDMFKEDYFNGNHLYYLGMVDGYVKKTHYLPLSYIDFKSPYFYSIMQQVLPNSDWENKDETSPAYIRNKPFYKETVYFSNEKINLPSPTEFFIHEEYNVTNYCWTGEMSLNIDPNQTYYYYLNDSTISSATPVLWDTSKPEEDSYVFTFQTGPSSAFMFVTNRELASTIFDSPYKSNSVFFLTKEDTFNAYRDMYLQGNTFSMGDFSGTRIEYHKLPINYLPNTPALAINSQDIDNWNNKQDALTAGTAISIDSGTIAVTIDTTMSDSSTNPVQNSIIKSYVDTTVGSINTILATLASIGGGS